MLVQFIHVTSAYSNAVLVAILPHISDCAQKLDLPISHPITTNQVSRFNVSPLQGDVGGGLWLTNQFFFGYEEGFVNSFRAPTNWFREQDIIGLKKYVGQDRMTTNAAIQLARSAFQKLGYQPSAFQMDEAPTTIEGPYDLEKLGHIPYCRIEWRSQNVTNQETFDRNHTITFCVNLESKQLVQMSLTGKPFFRPDPKVDVVPELETDYRKRTGLKMFVNTNAPAQLLPTKPFNKAE